VSFPSVGAVLGVKPFETSGKDSCVLKKAETRDDGPTGPVTSTFELLRPSVQLPAGIHGCAPYKGFDPVGKAKRLRLGLVGPGRANVHLA
jgi:hypothetical protein